MRGTFLPSAAPAPGQTGRQYLTSFLINETVAVDAGCLGLYRTPEEQARVRHVLLSHSHVDHLASLAAFVDNVYQAGPECVSVHGIDAVLDSLGRDLFNDRLWPDFLHPPAGRPPFLKLARLEAGRPVEVDGLRVTPVPVSHTVPTLGFLVEDGSAAVVFPSDTGPTEEIWQRANAASHLRAVFLEATFPQSMAGLAAVSGHLTTALFAAEVRKVRRPTRFIAVHIRARYHDQVVEELRALGHVPFGEQPP